MRRVAGARRRQALVACASLLGMASGGLLAQTPKAASMSPFDPHSQDLARRVQALPQLPLPDAWYPATGRTVAERFASTWRAMPPGPDKPPTAEALMARYENGGQPFAHSVWFNRPLRCERCNQGGADGFTTVVSLRHDLVLRLSAREMHDSLQHGLPLPEPTRAALDRLFGQPPRS